MNKRIKFFVIIGMMIMMIFPSAAFGVGTSVVLSGESSVEEGEIVTITVTYKGNALGYVDGAMSYNTANLEYLSGGSSQGDGGIVQLKGWSDDASGKITFAVKFRGVNAGSVKLDVDTYETQDLDGIEMGMPSSSKNMTVTRSSQETTEQETIEETTEQPSSSQESVASVPETSAGETAVDAESEDSGLSMNIILIGIAVAIIILAVAVIAALRRRKRR